MYNPLYAPPHTYYSKYNCTTVHTPLYVRKYKCTNTTVSTTVHTLVLFYVVSRNLFSNSYGNLNDDRKEKFSFSHMYVLCSQFLDFSYKYSFHFKMQNKLVTVIDTVIGLVAR